MADVAMLKAAVQALYSPTSSERERSEANAWLMTFASSPPAWEAARVLLTEVDEQVRYFGANLLFMKVRSEWHGLPEEAKASIYGVVRELVSQLASQSTAGGAWAPPSASGKRLCLVLAAAAVRSSALESFTTEALSMGANPALAPIALELLSALPQELLDRTSAAAAAATGAAADAAKRGAGVGAADAVPELRPELRALLPQVIRLLVSLLATAAPASGGPAAESCTTAVLRCLHSWLSLRMGCSLGTLIDSAPALLSAAMSGITSAAEPLSAAASDAIVELMLPANTQLSPTVPASVHATHALAEQLQQAAVSLRIPDTIATREPLDERQFNCCCALGAFAERACDVIAQTDGRLLPFVQLLFCLLGAELRVSELTIDFWSGLQDTPLVQRHEQLRKPLYRELLTRILDKCTLPPTFTTWDDEDELDKDEFERFREQSAHELLSTCLALLDIEFLDALTARMGGAGGGTASWQSFELVSYVVRCLHAEVKPTLTSDADAASLPAPPLAQQKERLRALLNAMIAPVAAGADAFTNQPAPLLSSAVRLYGSYGKWLAKEHEGALEGCVRIVLHALRVEEAAEHAAVAFRALCVHAQKQLARIETVQALMTICEPALRDEALSSELRIALIEGLARLVASLKDPSHTQQGLSALISPPCANLQAMLASLPPQETTPIPPASCEAVATQLQLVSSAIRFCDRFSLNERHPVLPVMQGCWPLLMEVARRFQRQTLIVQAMCDLYSRVMATLQTLVRPLLPQLLQHIATAYQTTPVVGCLTTLRDAIERFGKASDPELSDMLSQVMTVIIEHTCNGLASTPDPEAQPDLLTAFWEMCHRCLVFVPGLLLSLPVAPMLFEAAIGCVCHQEFQHTRAVLTFICLYLCPTESANEFRETSAMCLQTQGARLLRQCLTGLASVSPDNLVDHQVEVIRVLIEACPSAVSTWLKTLLADTAQPIQCGVVDPQGGTMCTFAQLVLQQPALPQGEFQCVASDFSRICRGKLGAEALDRYVQKYAANAAPPGA